MHLACNSPACNMHLVFGTFLPNAGGFGDHEECDPGPGIDNDDYGYLGDLPGLNGQNVCEYVLNGHA